MRRTASTSLRSLSVSLPFRALPTDTSSGDTIPNYLGEFREIRESNERAGIASDGHQTGRPGAPGVERLRPRENGLRSNGGERGKTD